MNGPQLGMGDLLDQNGIWYAREDGELAVVRLADMHSQHLANLRLWLLRNAPSLHAAEISALYGLTSHVSGEMALTDLDCVIARAEEMSPEAWLETKPLFEEITRLLGGRLDETHGD
jgi:hypothetical protein